MAPSQYIIADDGSGNVQTFLTTDYMATNPSAVLKTPTANFSFIFNGVLTDYTINQSFVVTPDLLAAMNLAGMPIV
jgi:hypothetical protein